MLNRMFENSEEKVENCFGETFKILRRKFENVEQNFET